MALESSRHTEDDAAGRRRIDTKGRSLRQHAARGTMVNTVFLVFLSSLSLLRGFVLAALLATEDYGIFGILAASIGTLLWLKQLGISDKYIQQDDEDQEAAFHKAFTLEAITTGAFTLLLAALIPVLVLVYGETRLAAPGLVVLLTLPAGVLASPLWVFYRRMDFVRQRLVQALDPVVGFLVAIALGILGAGYWALILGMVAGAWATALVALIIAPVRPRWNYDGRALRSYFSFSWPLVVNGGSSTVVAQAATITGNAVVGLSGVGAMALTSNISQFTSKVDGLISGTLYPAICAVRDRVELLEESFVKSNRLALIWAVPFGCAITLFCGDLVTYVIGEKWRPAVELLQIVGVNAAIGHIAFNWDSYMRATDRTKPIMVAGVGAAVAFLVIGLPLFIAFGLPGLAAAIVIQTLVHVAFRVYFLRSLFTNFSFIRQAMRAFLPVVPAIALVLCARLVEGDERTELMAVAELVVYTLAVIVATFVFEGRLLREARSYLGGGTPALAG